MFTKIDIEHLVAGGNIDLCHIIGIDNQADRLIDGASQKFSGARSSVNQSLGRPLANAVPSGFQVREKISARGVGIGLLHDTTDIVEQLDTNSLHRPMVTILREAISVDRR